MDIVDLRESNVSYKTPRLRSESSKVTFKVFDDEKKDESN